MLIGCQTDIRTSDNIPKKNQYFVHCWASFFLTLISIRLLDTFSNSFQTNFFGYFKFATIAHAWSNEIVTFRKPLQVSRIKKDSFDQTNSVEQPELHK